MRKFKLIMMVACLVLDVEGGAIWTETNCNLGAERKTFFMGEEKPVYGLPTDAICCNSTLSSRLCDSLDNKEDCVGENRCDWREEGGARCVSNRDEYNNVCCRPEDTQVNCMDLLHGKCPAAWQVPAECCPFPYNKYDGVLATSSQDTVCCNAPCTAIEMAWAGNASLGITANPDCKADMSPNCAPQMRSTFSSMDMFGGGNINPMLLSSMMGFPINQNSPQKFGQTFDLMSQMEDVAGPMGGTMALASMLSGQDYTEDVEEITVDDFFNSLIESLNNDNDLFQYNRDIYSDPIFGKQVKSI